jgi:hypothetical protein
MGCDGVNDFGGGVGVEATTTGGVFDLLLGAGDAGGLV